MYAYLGERIGARIIRYGVGVAQALAAGLPDTDPAASAQLDVTTPPLEPGGANGSCLFREIAVVVTHAGAVRLGVTPYLDGVAQGGEQAFDYAGSGTETLALPIALRGTRLQARIRTITRSGDVTIAGAQAAALIIRTSR